MENAGVDITPERYASGRPFTEYLDYIASPENLSRDGNNGSRRSDRSPLLRAWYEAVLLSEYQIEALRLLRNSPNGPSRILVIAEEWSSDCRRDVPVVARMAEAADMELRIFDRDGTRFSSSFSAAADGSPNADLMDRFLKHKDGQTWQSIPVVAFYNDAGKYLYHYVEYPAIYDKDRLVVANIRSPRSGETAKETLVRSEREFDALQASPFWRLWAGAAVDEMISALQRRLVLGTV